MNRLLGTNFLVRPSATTLRGIFDGIIAQVKKANYWNAGEIVEDVRPWGTLTFIRVGENPSCTFALAWCEEEDVIIKRSQDCGDGEHHEPCYSEHAGWPGYMGHW